MKCIVDKCVLFISLLHILHFCSCPKNTERANISTSVAQNTATTSSPWQRQYAPVTDIPTPEPLDNVKASLIILVNERAKETGRDLPEEKQIVEIWERCIDAPKDCPQHFWEYVLKRPGDARYMGAYQWLTFERTIWVSCAGLVHFAQ